MKALKEMTKKERLSVADIQVIYKGETAIDKPQMRQSTDVVACFRERYQQDQDLNYLESVYAMYLNRTHKVLGIRLVSKGSRHACMMDACVIFQGALLLNASAVIVCHNHPSGNLQPSETDNRSTDRLSRAGKVLDIKLLDHVILTENGYFSYADQAPEWLHD